MRSFCFQKALFAIFLDIIIFNKRNPLIPLKEIIFATVCNKTTFLASNR